MIDPAKSAFYQRLETAITELGGIYNAHMHLDRIGTLEEKYLAVVDHRILESSYISLQKKHSMISDLHQGPAFHPDDMHERVSAYLDYMASINTVKADTMVDVTADGVGLSALETLTAIKQEKANLIEMRIGAYSPLGFRDDQPERWELMVAGARKADFIGCLPEADDIVDYPSHIGFMEHCRRMLELAQELGKMAHVHVDQRNEPSEHGTEQLIEAVKQYGAPVSPSGEPMIWAVHLISPSTYDDDRFYRLVDGLIESNIGVITCPSGAIGMRQFRPISTPTYNCIPRLLEMLAAGVHVRVGSDNVADICSPSTTANLVDEIFILSAALRFYNPDILAKLAAGVKISTGDRDYIRDHLRMNDMEIGKFMRRAANERGNHRQ